MDKSREDEIARQAARALRAEGLVPLHHAGDGVLRTSVDTGEWRYTVATVHAMLSVAGRLDLVTRARTRITKGAPEEVLWVPEWVAELSEARQWNLGPRLLGFARDAIAEAEASPEVRAVTSAALAELRLALDAARLLGGDAAVARLWEARRGGR